MFEPCTRVCCFATVWLALSACSQVSTDAKEGASDGGNDGPRSEGSAGNGSDDADDDTSSSDDDLGGVDDDLISSDDDLGGADDDASSSDDDLGGVGDDSISSDDDGSGPEDDDAEGSDDDANGLDDEQSSAQDDDTGRLDDDMVGDDTASGGTGGSLGSGPAPSPSWVNATGNLANMASECGNLTLLSAVPDSNTVIAGVAKVGLFATDDGGQNWRQLGTGAGSAEITNRPGSIVYDPDHPGTFWESGIYNGGGVYKTTDGGETFEQLGEIGHNDLVSVDFTDPERQTLLVGGHEQTEMLYLSTNGGDSFDNIGANLPANVNFSSSPLVLDARTFLLGACGWGDGACGVFRSEDAGETWNPLSDIAATARPLVASDGFIYWPLIYNSGLARGTADGDFTVVSDGMVSSPPVELPDGRILQVKGEQLVASEDQGDSWNAVGEALPFAAAGVTFSAATKTLYVWQWDCGEVVLPNAIASAGLEL
jgi:photosystem II stability/assembly factor-like uncharacterized protein